MAASRHWHTRERHSPQPDLLPPDLFQTNDERATGTGAFTLKATECLNDRLAFLELNGLETLNITTAHSQARDGIPAQVSVADRFNTFETTARCVRTSACHKRLSFFSLKMCHTPDGPLVRNILSPDHVRMNGRRWPNDG